MEYKDNELLSIGNFSKLTGITRPNLIFYDKENLLKPIGRNTENDYRRYHFSQISTAYLIQVYRQVGLSLNQIKELLNSKSIEDERSMLQSHISKIDEQIQTLVQQKYNMTVYEGHLLKYGNRDNTNRFTVEEMPSEFMTLSPLLRNTKENLTTMNDFLIYYRAHGMQMDCHIGRMFTKETLSSNDWESPEYFYFKKVNGTHKKKKGLYLIYTTYSDGSDINEIYITVLKYIKQHSYNITGNIYEDYPLSSLLAISGTMHMIRIMMPISI